MEGATLPHLVRPQLRATQGPNFGALLQHCDTIDGCDAGARGCRLPGMRISRMIPTVTSRLVQPHVLNRHEQTANGGERTFGPWAPKSASLPAAIGAERAPETVQSQQDISRCTQHTAQVPRSLEEGRPCAPCEALAWKWCHMPAQGRRGTNRNTQGLYHSIPRLRTTKAAPPCARNARALLKPRMSDIAKEQAASAQRRRSRLTTVRHEASYTHDARCCLSESGKVAAEVARPSCARTRT